MYRLESRQLAAPRYYLSYQEAVFDAKARGVSIRCIKPVH
jgi:hypothetical protein